MEKLIHFDWAMKYLLRQKANFEILEGFLNELLNKEIKIENILESESNKNLVDDKFNRVDLLVSANHQERIIIEVQCASEWDYLQRIARPYAEIPKVISINILFFDLGKGEDYLYHGSTIFRGFHKNDILQLGPLEQRFCPNLKTPAEIFPEYYLLKVRQFTGSIKTRFDQWMYLLKNEQVRPEFTAQGIQAAAEKLAVLKLKSAERVAYDIYRENTVYEASMIASSKEEGRVKRKIEGLIEGRIEGEKIGEERGIIKVAQKLLSQGLDYKFICQVTGLTIDELESLIKIQVTED